MIYKCTTCRATVDLPDPQDDKPKRCACKGRLFPIAMLPVAEEHHCFVIRVYRKRDDDQWFFTVRKDAIMVFTSGDFKEKPKFAFP